MRAKAECVSPVQAPAGSPYAGQLGWAPGLTIDGFSVPNAITVRAAAPSVIGATAPAAPCC